MNRRKTSPAFTLVELLVVIVIIALLVGITLVATGGAMRAGQSAATRYLMHSIAEGLEQFHGDFGYYPPLLKDDGQIVSPARTLIEAQPDAQDLFRTYRYFSATTLPVYLIGVGRLDPTEITAGLDPDRHDGKGGPGFRDPGPDRSWGGAVDRALARPTRTGRVYGPYIDAGDGEALRELRPSDFASTDNTNNPRYIDLASGEFPRGPDASIYVIQDSWNVPIRYYQPRWPRRNVTTGALTLDNIPLELLSPDVVRGNFRPELDREILSAEYALLSAGPDGEFTGRLGLDQGETTDLGITPMTTATNSDFFDSISDKPGVQRDLLGAMKDNIRVIK